MRFSKSLLLCVLIISWAFSCDQQVEIASSEVCAKKHTETSLEDICAELVESRKRTETLEKEIRQMGNILTIMAQNQHETGTVTDSQLAEIISQTQAINQTSQQIKKNTAKEGNNIFRSTLRVLRGGVAISLGAMAGFETYVGVVWWCAVAPTFVAPPGWVALPVGTLVGSTVMLMTLAKTS